MENNTSFSNYEMLPQNLPLLIVASSMGFIFAVECGIWILLMTVGILYCCCKKSIKSYTERHPGTLKDTLVAKWSWRLSYCYCNSVECITAWTLVDLLRTPNLSKDSQDNKVIIRVSNTYSFQLGKNIRKTFLIFFFILSVPFLFVGKILADMHEQIGSLYTDRGDNYTAICNIVFSQNLTLQKNCYEQLRQADGTKKSVLCLPIFSDIMNSLGGLAGLYGLYAVIFQIYKSVALNTFCKQCCYKGKYNCSNFFIYLFIMMYLPVSAMIQGLIVVKGLKCANSVTTIILPYEQYLLYFTITHGVIIAHVVISYALEPEKQDRLEIEAEDCGWEPPGQTDGTNSNPLV
jgi:NADH:ubiquinone oxidoreductase subunit 3 (subunit A)